MVLRFACDLGIKVDATSRLLIGNDISVFLELKIFVLWKYKNRKKKIFSTSNIMFHSRK